MEKKVRWQSDNERAELRNTSADVRRTINQSIQAFRDVFSDNGDSYFLSSKAGRMTPGRANVDGTFVPWGTIDISAVEPAVVRIMGLDVVLNGQFNVELDHISFAQRNYNQDLAIADGIPQSFFSYDQNTLAIVPAPQFGYEYILWYLPLLPELMADDDEFDPGIPGADEWVVFDTCVKLHTRDNNLKWVAAFKMLRDDTWMRVLKHASSRQRVGPTYRLDTRGRRISKRLMAFWGYGRTT